MISGKQIRAGRLLLNVDSDELARISKVGLATIKRFEAASGIPPSRSGNLEKVKTALEARGVVFLGVGVFGSTRFTPGVFPPIPLPFVFVFGVVGSVLRLLKHLQNLNCFQKSNPMHKTERAQFVSFVCQYIFFCKKKN